MGDVLKMKGCAFKMMLATWAAIAVATGATLVGLTMTNTPAQQLSGAVLERGLSMFFLWFAATFAGGTGATLAVWAVRGRVNARRRAPVRTK
jgi:hypothetical protein